jgi:hypothetical protein
MLVWMKSEYIYQLFLVAFQNKWECSCFCDLDVAIKHHVTSYSTSIVTINPSYVNVHEIKCNKNELANEIVEFDGLIFFLSFLEWISY